MAKKRKGKAAKTASKKSGLPSWVKPTLSMIFGGGVGLVAMSLLPESIAPYAPAMGVLAAKFLGGGSWGKYLCTAGVVGGVTFLSRRKTVQIAAGSLAAAKRALAANNSGTLPAAPGGSGNPADTGRDILRRSGLRTA